MGKLGNTTKSILGALEKPAPQPKAPGGLLSRIRVAGYWGLVPKKRYRV